MQIDQKLFSLDKNYLLKQSQADLQDSLSIDLVVRSIQAYHHHFNPLGLIDNTITQIEAFDTKTVDLTCFDVFYQKLAAIYRFQHGDIQLEFLWDGRSHIEYYQEEWSDYFKAQTTRMFQVTGFIRLILELTVFADQSLNKQMLVYRLSSIIREQFQMQVFKRKGVILTNIG